MHALETACAGVLVAAVTATAKVCFLVSEGVFATVRAEALWENWTGASQSLIAES